MPAVVPMLLGVHGLKGSGKNTAAEILEEWCGKAFVARSQGLADALKVSAARSLGFEGSVAECIEFCDVLKRRGAEVVAVEHTEGNTGPDPEAPYSEVLAKVTGREFLQLYGTEGHREVFGTDFWIDHLLPLDKKRLYAKWDREPGVLTQLMMVTDVRFPNEAERIKELDGFVIKIRRPGVEASLDQHASEKPLPAELIDEVIVNDSTLEDLRVRLFAFAERRMFDGLKSGSGRWD